MRRAEIEGHEITSEGAHIERWYDCIVTAPRIGSRQLLSENRRAVLASHMDEKSGNGRLASSRWLLHVRVYFHCLRPGKPRQAVPNRSCAPQEIFAPVLSFDWSHSARALIHIVKNLRAPA